MLSSYNADMEFAKENPEYSDWIEDIEANMSALRDVTLVVGDAETIYIGVLFLWLSIISI